MIQYSVFGISDLLHELLITVPLYVNALSLAPYTLSLILMTL